MSDVDSTDDSLKSRQRSRSDVSWGELVCERRGNIRNFYKIDNRPIGAGAYGLVHEAKNLDTHETRACKTMVKSNMNVGCYKKEIWALKKLSHPNIIKIFETLEDDKNVHIIMELCRGGTPTQRITNTNHFSERQAAILTKQIFRGLCYMNELHFCHRDLKPENFLLSDNRDIEETSLKIIDFGYATQVSPGVLLSTKVGSSYYVAPQVLEGKYTAACDLWSVGVILYVLLCGYPPFKGASEKAIVSRVHRGVFHFHGEVWDTISEDAKDLIRGLLTMDPSKRCTAADALHHVWIAKLAPNHSGEAVLPSMVKNLRRFQEANVLKQAALQVIANNAHEEEIREIHDAFVAIDEKGDGDGMISIDELKMALSEVGAKIVDLEDIVQAVDCKGLGSIDYNEFVAATLDFRTYSEEEACWVAFSTFDKDGTGVIKVSSLSQFSHETIEEDSFLHEHEEDGINFEEFLGMMRRRNSIAPESAPTEGPRLRASRMLSNMQIEERNKQVHPNQGWCAQMAIRGLRKAVPCCS